MIVEIPVEDLLSVLPFKSTDDVRYYLNGVRVEPCDGGAMLIATNGHALAAIFSPGSRADTGRILAISADFEKAIREARASPNGRVCIESETSYAIVRDDFKERFIQPGVPFVDGKYPDWRRVVPTPDQLRPGLLSLMDSALIRNVRRAADTNIQRVPVNFWHDVRDPEKNAVVARIATNPRLIMILMPMTAAEFGEWPEWMTPKGAEAAA